jgi:serine/threonine-protein kinase
VVIKLLLPEHAQDDRFVQMFVREAQILSQLRHPSLVDVLEFGEEDGAYVLVLEYVRGYHLGQWARFLAAKKREAPADILIQIAVDVLDALHHAHNQVHPDGAPMQIVHRDVSPSNILLDEDGRARLLDFGVARMRGGVHEFKTQVDGIMGKLPYTAPEMFAGVSASPKSDLYACGVVLHEALLGRNVFRAEMQAATLQRVMTHVPEPLERGRLDVPAGLDAVLAKALAKATEDRHADAREFAGALRKLQREQESDIRARLAELLKNDFAAEMAEMLSLESLARRDEAWRRLSTSPERPTGAIRTSERSANLSGKIAQPMASTPPTSLPSVPQAIGATVANSPLARSAARQQPSLPPPAFEIAPERAAQVGGLEANRELTPGDQKPAARALRLQPKAAGAFAHQRAIVLGMVVLGCLGLVAIWLSLRSAPAAPPSVPKIRVVALPIVPSAPEPNQAATAGGVAPVTTRQLERPARKEAKRNGPDARALTQAFRKQQSKLEACFKQNSVSLEGRPTTQLAFDLDAAGKLTRVELTPQVLASTPLGGCLLRVARSTAFPAQGRAVSFAIPLSARGVAAD